jgi:DNA adenine methylase Dam
VLSAIGDCSDKTFIEPFVGSATVALNVDAAGYLLNDINKNLINAHRQVSLDPTGVMALLEPMLNSKRENYYSYRAEFNLHQGTPKFMAALFIYLNRCGFNGLYRENKSGGFNVPIGVGNIMNPSDLMHEFIFSGVDFSSDDFEEIIDLAESNDVVYVDSPYPKDNISETDFKYTKDGFGLADHTRLAESVKRAHKRGAKVIVSNSSTDLTRRLYADATETIEILARRSVGRDAATRGNVKELIFIYK